MQPRDLELETVGDDVDLLQLQLQEIGFPIEREERDGTLFGRSTQQAVTFLQDVYATALRQADWQGRPGVVEHATASLILDMRDRVVAERETTPPIVEPEYRVAGSVHDATGQPVARAVVTVSNQNVKGSVPLDVAPTDETGAFGVAFDFRLDDAEARSALAPPAPDLRFVVVDADGHERRVVALDVMTNGSKTPIGRIAPSSDAPFIVVNASKDTRVALSVAEAAGGQALSEFEEVEARLAPALQRLSYDELQEGDGHFQVSFLAAETGVVRGIIDRLIVSARSSRVTANHKRLVPVAVFYGLGHASLPVDLAALSRLPRTDLTSALRQAIADAVIPTALADDIERHVDAILSIGAEQALATPLGEGSESPRAWLALAGLTAEAQQRLVRELADREGPDDGLWEKLRDDTAMGGPDKVRRAELALRLASFTGNNFPLVRLLLDAKELDVRSVSEVAKLDEPAWLALVARAGVPEDLREEGPRADAAGEEYARGLMRVAQQAYPTAAVEGIAARSHRDLALDPDVSTWLGAAARAAQDGKVPALDLRSTHIDRYFEEHGRQIAFQTRNPERLRSDLKRVQRTLAIVQEPAQIGFLLRAGHDSALRVANMSASMFLEVHSETLGVETARAIHARARQVHFAHLFVHTMVFDAVKDEGMKL